MFNELKELPDGLKCQLLEYMWINEQCWTWMCGKLSYVKHRQNKLDINLLWQIRSDKST